MPLCDKLTELPTLLTNILLDIEPKAYAPVPVATGYMYMPSAMFILNFVIPLPL